jgi:putative 4-mercaptohistidine N1-methyltranferase
VFLISYIMSRISSASLLEGVALGAISTIAISYLYSYLHSSEKKKTLKKSNTIDDSEKESSTDHLPALPLTYSTTSSGHNINVYETDVAVAEYLQFHFGEDDHIMPYPGDIAPVAALNFASRTANLCVEWAKKMNLSLDSAFDVGCAVGRTAFDLSKEFKHVVGLDYSQAFVNAADKLKASKKASYRCTIEGSITEEYTVTLPSDVNADRCSFIQGDACNLPTNVGPFTVIHGANLLCRLPNPRDFLRRLPSLLVPGGLVVLISPYSWLPQYTPTENWIGATVDDSTKLPKRSSDELVKIMESLGFKLVHEENVPFLIREHARKFQWGCSHATIFQLQPIPLA